MTKNLIAMARAAEKDERLSDGALYGKLADRIEQLQVALRMVMENMGGHQHWDSFGTAGVNCPICQRQTEAATQASEILGGITLASPIDTVPDLREALCIILGWYEEIPNDELPGKGVRDAIRIVNDALGVPEK